MKTNTPQTIEKIASTTPLFPKTRTNIHAGSLTCDCERDTWGGWGGMKDKNGVCQEANCFPQPWQGG